MAFFSGDAGNNSISGTSSADTMFGVTGNDTLYGNQANDTLHGNSENDHLFGGYDDDLLLGGQGNDFLSGDRGKDILQGDAQTDTLVGGADSDTFVISKKVNPTPSGTMAVQGDQIIDFVDKEDFLGLNNLTFNDLIITSTGGNSTLITDISGQSLAVLQGVNPSQIDASDFIISPQPNTLINGIASGDTTQTSTVLWARSVTPGLISFELFTDPNLTTSAGISQTQVTDPNVPVKVGIEGLKPSTQYYYQITDASQNQLSGKFQTSDPLGTRNGLRFGVSGDLQGNLAPFVSLKNADQRNLDFFVQLGDMPEADAVSSAIPGVTQAKTLEEFRLKQNEIYSQRYGLNPWTDLRASTSVYATWDDHELTNDFAGGTTPAKSPQKQDIFGKETTGYVNDTPVFDAALQSFQDYFPVRNEYYGNTNDPRTAEERKLYRNNNFGSDAATFVLDVRSFRDAPLPFVAEDADQTKIDQTLSNAFDPNRTMLGQAQFNQLKDDLLAAQNNG
ncbi:MAG: alkaline phosphatase D family protein, partial [Planktothrix sp.]